ncbi:MAG: hypothetical protein LBC96_04855 [Lachnospiraceae bacterium]|nr:hypothetical protein [Lachnospiraceae bacterium]
MRIHFGQIYIQVGRIFPFSHAFQIFLGEKITELVEPSPRYNELHGENFKLIFRISAKWQLAVNEVVGPKVYKKDKDVEYSIFLPYTPIMQEPEPNRSALENLFEGVYEVLGGYEIDISAIKAEQEGIIDKILSSPEMFVNEDD